MPCQSPAMPCHCMPRQASTCHTFPDRARPGKVWYRAPARSYRDVWVLDPRSFHVMEALKCHLKPFRIHNRHRLKTSFNSSCPGQCGDGAPCCAMLCHKAACLARAPPCHGSACRAKRLRATPPRIGPDQVRCGIEQPPGLIAMAGCWTPAGSR